MEKNVLRKQLSFGEGKVRNRLFAPIVSSCYLQRFRSNETESTSLETCLLDFISFFVSFPQDVFHDLLKTITEAASKLRKHLEFIQRKCFSVHKNVT